MWIDVNQSPYLLSFIIVVHSIAIITCLMLPLTFALIVLILLLPVSSLYLYLQRYRRGFYTLSLKYSAEFSWELIEGDHYSSMRILKSSVLTSFIIVLHTEIDNKRRNLLVCRDAVLGDKYRQLFVALKIMKLE
ncbi:MAG: protein YgfX [Methyloprofundus sp.]